MEVLRQHSTVSKPYLTVGSQKFAEASILAIDVKNAFNSRDRAVIAKSLYQDDRLRQFVPLFRFIYGSPSDLLVESDGFSIKSIQGVRQGCTLGSFLFALSIQRQMESVKKKFPTVGIIMVHDDITLVGPLAHVTDAFMEVNRVLGPDLVINTEKSILFTDKKDACEHAADRMGVKPAQATFIKILGGAVGHIHQSFSAEMMKEFVDARVQSSIDHVKSLLEDDFPMQHALFLLRRSILAEFQYPSRVLPTSVFAEKALELDQLILEAISAKLKTGTLSGKTETQS